MYIVHRTQLYLDDDIYRALAAVASSEGKTISEAVRERLARSLAERRVDPLRAIDRALGAWGDRSDLPATDGIVRDLRRSERVRRHGKVESPRRRR